MKKTALKNNKKEKIMTQDFLPQGYEKLRPQKPYINLSKLAEGEYKFRIVANPILGWVEWREKKPYRFPIDQKPLHSADKNNPLKPFWALYVWDYTKEGLYVMEVTQTSIQNSLCILAEDEDWGNCTKYDIKLKKEGSGKDTKYAINPVPHKPMSKIIVDALESAPVRLSALYEGKDPWTDLEEPSGVSESLESLDTELYDRVDNLIKSEEGGQKIAEGLMSGLHIDNLLEANNKQLSFLEENLMTKLVERRQRKEYMKAEVASA